MKGEICLKGPQVMKEYLGKPEETANSIDKDGFFHTGDVGYMDEDGYIFIVDRIKDMVIVSGLKVFPRKVEDALMQHPDVSEVIVIGLPDEKTGERVKAFIAPKEGKTLSPQDIRDFLDDKLSPYEMPKEVEFRKELPKTDVGKPDKKSLRAEEKAKAEKKTMAPPAPKPPGA
jgi:long-chain acyl-CoA synthetase